MFSDSVYGGAFERTHPPLYMIDCIDISSFWPPRINQKASELYKDGHSLSEVAVRLDLPKSTVRKVIQRSGAELRPHARRRGRAIGSAPYGYVWIEGELIEDQREQRVIQIILEHWWAGKKFSDIAEVLNRQKIRPRLAEKWDGGTIRKIVIRAQKSNA